MDANSVNPNGARLGRKPEVPQRALEIDCDSKREAIDGDWKDDVGISPGI
jgi:hypothetical protein